MSHAERVGHDLVLLALDEAGRKTLVGVEAKADESFDAPVAARIRRSRKEAEEAALKERSYDSAQIPRIERFSRALLGREALTPGGEVDPVVGEQPYQLLASLAGTLIEAEKRGAEQAVLAVHSFHSSKLKPERIAANDAGFEVFLAALAGGPNVRSVKDRLHGPFSVPGGEGIPAMPLYVGIATTML